jgi:hypothetical protein
MLETLKNLFVKLVGLKTNSIRYQESNLESSVTYYKARSSLQLEKQQQWAKPLKSYYKIMYSYNTECHAGLPR